jgi:hypothetical protein
MQIFHRKESLSASGDTYELPITITNIPKLIQEFLRSGSKVGLLVAIGKLYTTLVHTIYAFGAFGGLRDHSKAGIV